MTSSWNIVDGDNDGSADSSRSSFCQGYWCIFQTLFCFLFRIFPGTWDLKSYFLPPPSLLPLACLPLLVKNATSVPWRVQRVPRVTRHFFSNFTCAVYVAWLLVLLVTVCTGPYLCGLVSLCVYVLFCVWICSNCFDVQARFETLSWRPFRVRPVLIHLPDQW